MASMWSLGGLSWKDLFKRVARQFSAHRLADQAAVLAYYFLFSIFPLLLFLISLLGFFLEPGSALHQVIIQYAGKVLPPSASGLIDGVLREISHNASVGKLSIGLIVALWSASSGMSAVISSLNIAYEVGEQRAWWKEKLLAITLTIVVSILLIVAVVLAVYGESIADKVASALGLGWLVTWLWKILQWPILLLLVLSAFNLVYYFAPNCRRLHWHWLMPGTAVGVGLWLLASIAFKVYLAFFNSYSVTYGSIATIIILLLWFYMSGMALLFGGQVNAEIEKMAK